MVLAMGAPPHWIGYTAVDDVDASVKKATSLGGKVLAPAFDIPKVGRVAVLADPQGAAFAIVHLIEDMPAAALRPSNGQLVARARELGQALGLDDLHLYRFAGQYRSLNLLCRGELRPGGSQCLGVQADE